MQPAAEKLQAALAELNLHTPEIPVVNNVDVRIETDVARIKDALVRQAWHPVRWVECAQFIAEQGVTDMVECGPGKVLAGLAKRIDARLAGHALVDQASLNTIRAALNN